MAKGDQVYTMREWIGVPGVYEHHGIDCGDGSVIHFRKTDEAVIARTSWETFSRNNSVFVRHYDVCFTPDVVVTRAASRLGERNYDLFTNNCEHFATWCKIGQERSAQLETFGVHLDRYPVPDLRQLIEQTAQGQRPETALTLFNRAMGNIATAYSTLQPQYQTAQQEQDTWQQVAQKALEQGREDLARAALYRKRAARQKAAELRSQLDQLVELETNLQRNQSLIHP